MTKLKLPYTSPSAAFVPQWVALEQGFFTKHGLDVTVNYQETNTVSPALIGGEIDVATTPSTLNIMLSGGDAVFIANLLTAPVFSLYSNNEVPDVKALKDKVIGNTPPGSAPDGALRALLAKNGLNPASDVKYITSPDPSTIVAAMKAGQAAAGILSAPSTVAAKQAGFKELSNTAKEAVPGLHSVVSVRKSALAQNRQAYAQMLLALRDAIEFAKANPGPTKAIVRKYTKADPGPALDEAYDAFQPYWQLGPVKLPDVQAALQYSSNPAAASFNPQSVIDNSVVESLK
jgi:NitT/TauT family transport system substrate-binding protein